MLDDASVYVGDKSGTVSFGLDAVYTHRHSAEEVWQGMQSDLEQGLAGANVCLIAYGES